MRASAGTPRRGRPSASPGDRRRSRATRHDYISLQTTGAKHGVDEPDDDGLLEEVVEEILGENLPPPEAENPCDEVPQPEAPGGARRAGARLRPVRPGADPDDAAAALVTPV